ncbi:hypothetical protein L1887_52935 [Cichorium endivia]|nr:hypothetical protein L1887_52935 [Cichorium endivia]
MVELHMNINSSSSDGLKNPNASVTNTGVEAVCTALGEGYSLTAADKIVNINENDYGNGKTATRAADSARLWSEWGIATWGTLWTSNVGSSSSRLAIETDSTTAYATYYSLTSSLNAACSKSL